MELTRDYRDLITGSVLAALGAAFAYTAATRYGLGTIQEMGPGMFPMGLGILLAGFGMAIAAPAAFRRGSAVEFDLRPAIAVLASLAAFAVTVKPFGLVPAIVALTFVAATAGGRLAFKRVGLLALFLAAFATVIFVWALGMLIPIVALPV